MQNEKIVFTSKDLQNYSKTTSNTVNEIEKNGEWNEQRTELSVSREKLLEVLEASNVSTPAATDIVSLNSLKNNYELSVFRWAILGFPVVKKEDCLSRITACKGCSFWDSHERSPNIGHCVLSGESNIKPWLANEQCPTQKWSASNTQESQS
jgi:hypothetical protein